MTCYRNTAAAPRPAPSGARLCLSLCHVWRPEAHFVGSGATCPECRHDAGEPPLEGDE